MDEFATLIREGKTAQAEAELDRRLAEGARTAVWYFHQGLLLEAKGLREEAIEAYEQGLNLDHGHEELVFRLAHNLDLYGEEDRAIELYKSLVQRQPAHVSALLNLAVLYEDRDCYQEAFSCVQRVLAEHPNHPRARLFLKDIQSSMTMRYDENQERDQAKRDAVLDIPVSDFELSVRSRNCLKKMSINVLGDLLRISEAELLSYKNFGETSLNEIRAMLKQKGLHLGQLRQEDAATKLVRPPRPLAQPAPASHGPSEIFSRSLAEIEFSSRARKCLQRLGVTTLGELAMKTEPELLAAKNFGQTSLAEVRDKLSGFGLSLRKPD